jgi:hypothetical protein
MAEDICGSNGVLSISTNLSQVQSSTLSTVSILRTQKLKLKKMLIGWFFE